MARNGKNYSEGKIYKIEPICEHDEDEIYIGSTTKQYLSQRMVEHRRTYQLWKEGKTHITSSYKLFDKYGVENCEIILLESVSAKNYNELVAREAHYIRTLKCINKVLPTRTKKQYIDDNKEAILIQQKEYRKNNAEKIKQYRIDNKSIISMKAQQRIQCKCGTNLRNDSIFRHIKSKKHLNYINSKTL